MVDRWHLFYNGATQFHEVAAGAGDSTDILDETLYDVFVDIVRRGTHE